MALVGGLLCCVGDLLFDLKGKGNEKLGTSKNIDSNWNSSIYDLTKNVDLWSKGISVGYIDNGEKIEYQVIRLYK